MRARAFTVPGLAGLDQMQTVLDNLTAATETGQSWHAWKKATLRDVPAVAALPKGRLETVFRNAIQSHYAIGRREQHARNAAHRPFLMYSSINDGRTRESHRAMNGYIAPVDDPIWQKRTPPWAHRCRCSVISLTEKQALARGWKGVVAAPPAKDKGDWDESPVVANDAGLKQAIEARRRVCISGLFAAGKGGKVWCDTQGMKYLEQLNKSLSAQRGMLATQEDVARFHGNAIANRRVKQAALPVMIMPDDFAALAERLDGVSVRGKTYALDHDYLLHIQDTHGHEKEALRGQLPIEADDYMRIGLALNDAQEVSFGKPARSKNGALKITSRMMYAEFDYDVVLEVRRRHIVPFTLWKRLHK